MSGWTFSNLSDLVDRFNEREGGPRIKDLAYDPNHGGITITMAHGIREMVVAVSISEPYRTLSSGAPWRLDRTLSPNSITMFLDAMAALILAPSEDEP